MIFGLKLSAIKVPRTVGEGVWVAAGQIASAIAALASIKIMTELLPPSEFGRLALLMGVAALALGLSAGPRLQAVLRFYSDYARLGQVALLRRVSRRLVGGAVFVWVIAVASAWAVGVPTLGGTWFTGALIAAILVVDSVRLFELTLLNAARRQRTAALIHAADAWSRPFLAIVAVLSFGPNATAALAGYVTGSTLVVIVMLLTAKLEGAGPPAPQVTVDSTTEMETELAITIRRYALPLVPLALFGWINGVGDRYVISGMIGLDAAGLYAAAYGLTSRPFLMLSNIIEMTLRPQLHDAVATADSSIISASKQPLLVATAAGAAIGVIAFSCLSDLAATLVLGAGYDDASGLMPWIALGYALHITTNVFLRYCYAFDDTRAILTLKLFGAVIGLVVLIPAILIDDLPGAAKAVPLYFGLELILSILLAQRAERAFFARKAPATSPPTHIVDYAK